MRIRWWCWLGALSIGILGLDIVTAPVISFPIMFVIPVGLAARHLGRQAAIGLAVLLVVGRFGTAVALEPGLIPVWAAVVNASIRLVVLVGLAEMVALARQTRILAERVQTLEGIIPICAVCKRIRRPDGLWEQIEVYISKRSDAEFSHGLCEPCAHDRYGKYLPARDSGGAAAVAAP